jgi:hypothetical protein
MAKNPWQDDSMEGQLLEFGVSTVKNTAKGIAKAFNPLAPFLDKKN